MTDGQKVRQFHTKYKLPLDRVLADESTAAEMGDGGAVSLTITKTLARLAATLIDTAKSMRDQAWLYQQGGDGRMWRGYFLIAEVGECLAELASKDEVKLAHELADLKYIIDGTAEQYGLPLELVFDAIHKSNMTKRVDAIRDKNPPYTPPDVRSALVMGRINRQYSKTTCRECGSGDADHDSTTGVVKCDKCKVCYAQPRERDTIS